MRGEGRQSVVQVMIVGDREFALCNGEFVGEAEHVVTVNNEERTPEAPEEENLFWRTATTMSTSRWQSTSFLRNWIWVSRQQERDSSVTVEWCTSFGQQVSRDLAATF